MLRENMSNVSLSDLAQVMLLCRKLVNVISPTAHNTEADSKSTQTQFISFR